MNRIAGILLILVIAAPARASMLDDFEHVTVDFVSGGTATVAQDDVLTGQTSGAVGRVLNPPSLTGGSWAGGDAAGSFLLMVESGTFQNGEVVLRGGTDAATLDSAPALSTTKAYNYTGLYDRWREYGGCNSNTVTIDPAFGADGTSQSLKLHVVGEGTECGYWFVPGTTTSELVSDHCNNCVMDGANLANRMRFKVWLPNTWGDNMAAQPWTMHVGDYHVETAFGNSPEESNNYHFYNAKYYIGEGDWHTVEFNICPEVRRDTSGYNRTGCDPIQETANPGDGTPDQFFSTLTRFYYAFGCGVGCNIPWNTGFSPPYDVWIDQVEFVYVDPGVSISQAQRRQTGTMNQTDPIYYPITINETSGTATKWALYISYFFKGSTSKGCSVQNGNTKLWHDVNGDGAWDAGDVLIDGDIARDPPADLWTSKYVRSEALETPEIPAFGSYDILVEHTDAPGFTEGEVCPFFFDVGPTRAYDPGYPTDDGESLKKVGAALLTTECAACASEVTGGGGGGGGTARPFGNIDSLGGFIR